VKVYSARCDAECSAQSGEATRALQDLTGVLEPVGKRVGDQTVPARIDVDVQPRSPEYVGIVVDFACVAEGNARLVAFQRALE
jgi:hypothetical protein